MITIRLITSEADFEIAKHIRHQVFVLEQNVPAELEFDEYETISRHFLAFLHAEPVGVARWRTTNHGVKLERFAVLEKARKKGIGSILVKTLLEDIKQQKPNSYIYLHAQITAVNLYRRFGFQEVGELFNECGIQHYKMEKFI